MLYNENAFFFLFIADRNEIRQQKTSHSSRVSKGKRYDRGKYANCYFSVCFLFSIVKNWTKMKKTKKNNFSNLHGRIWSLSSTISSIRFNRPLKFRSFSFKSTPDFKHHIAWDVLSLTKKKLKKHEKHSEKNSSKLTCNRREDICFQHYRPNQIDKIDDCI